MKKKIIAIALISTMAISCLNLSGCLVSKTDSSATSDSSASSFVSEYASKYDFYADSVEKLKDDMELTDEEADKVFGALIEVGLDKEISYCFDEKDDNDNPYFKVWWGTNKVDVYLKDNAVDKILEDDEIIYQNGKVVEPTTEKPAEKPTEKPTEKATEKPADSMTVSQKNALKSAESYLRYSSFSYTGLIEQLEYEKYSHEDAVYAVDHCGADWNEQAVKKAKSYLDYSSFSRDGLIEQLEYEGFTHEQAVYGVEQNGL